MMSATKKRETRKSGRLALSEMASDDMDKIEILQKVSFSSVIPRKKSSFPGDFGGPDPKNNPRGVIFGIFSYQGGGGVSGL